MTPSREQQKRINSNKLNSPDPREHTIAIVDELERITDEVATLKDSMKMMCDHMTMMAEHIKMISKPEFPEIPPTDLTETNALLSALLEEEQKPEEPIKVTLQLE